MTANISMHTYTSELHLRPHHLLCLQTFIGRGYSKEFVEHMTLVKKQLTDEPHTPITLVHGADDLCTHCLNCVEGRCISEKPVIFDRLVEEKLMAFKRKTGTFQSRFSSVREVTRTPDLPLRSHGRCYAPRIICSLSKSLKARNRKLFFCY